MASGKQLVDAITKLLSAGKTAKARAAVEADKALSAPIRSPEATPLTASEMLEASEKVPKAITGRQAVDAQDRASAILAARSKSGDFSPEGAGPDLHYFGEEVVEKAQPNFMVEMLEKAAKDPAQKKASKGTFPTLETISEELGTTTPKPRGYSETLNQLKSDKKALETGRWPKGGEVKAEHEKGLKTRIARNEKKLRERQIASGNPKDVSDTGPTVFGETAGPIERSNVPKSFDTVPRKTDAEGNPVKYEPTEGAISRKLSPTQTHFQELEQFENFMAGKPVSPIGVKKLPTGKAEGAGPIDIEKSKQSPKPKGRDDDDVTSREMANELSAESDPNVIRRMQDLDLMAGEHDKMLRDVHSMYSQWLKNTGKNSVDINRDREIIEDFVNRVASAKQADEAMVTMGQGKPRAETPYGEEVPLSIENLRATALQGPRTAEDAARGRVVGQPITKQEGQEFLSNVNRELAGPIARQGVEAGRAKTFAPIVPKNMENWPRPESEKLVNLIDELLYGPAKGQQLSLPLGMSGKLSVSKPQKRLEVGESPDRYSESEQGLLQLIDELFGVKPRTRF